MNRVRKFNFLAALGVASLLIGCSGGGGGSTSTRQVNTDVAAAWASVDGGAILLDVRDFDQHDIEHIEGSICIPYKQLRDRIDLLPADKNYPIVVYCQKGTKSRLAYKYLVQQGYTNVICGMSYDAMRAMRPEPKIAEPKKELPMAEVVEVDEVKEASKPEAKAKKEGKEAAEKAVEAVKEKAEVKAEEAAK